MLHLTVKDINSSQANNEIYNLKDYESFLKIFNNLLNKLSIFCKINSKNRIFINQFIYLLNNDDQFAKLLYEYNFNNKCDKNISEYHIYYQPQLIQELNLINNMIKIIKKNHPLDDETCSKMLLKYSQQAEKCIKYINNIMKQNF